MYVGHNFSLFSLRLRLRFFGTVQSVRGGRENRINRARGICYFFFISSFFSFFLDFFLLFSLSWHIMSEGWKVPKDTPSILLVLCIIHTYPDEETLIRIEWNVRTNKFVLVRKRHRRAPQTVVGHLVRVKVS